MEQEIQPPQANSSKNQLFLAVTISVLVTTVIIGGIAFYLIQQMRNQEIDSLKNEIKNLQSQQVITANPLAESVQTRSTQVMEDPAAGTILLATQNKEQTPPPANPGNLMKEYSITSFNPKYGTQKQIAMIKNNMFKKPFAFSDNTIYFLNPAGELTALDLKTQTTKAITIDGIIPTKEYLNDNTISDFILSEGKIFYLKGECTEESYCAAGVYNLATGKNEIILDHLEKQVESTIFNVTHVASYDSVKNILKIRDSSGDAGSSSVTVYELNVATKKLTKVDYAERLDYCGENDGDCPSPQRKAENEKFDKIFETQLSCHDTKIITFLGGLGWELTIISENYQKTFEETYYVGCMNK